MEILDIIGLIAFTISGYMIAQKHNLDLLGVFIVSFFTALGGGFIRDISVNEIPFIFKETYPLLTVLFTIIIFKFISNLSEQKHFKKILFFSDTIGLVTFSITGAMVAINHDLNITGVILLAFLTAAGGGIIRDLFVNTVPFVFKEDFYGSIAILIAVALYFIDDKSPLTIITIFILGIIIRLVAVKYKFELPKIK